MKKKNGGLVPTVTNSLLGLLHVVQRINHREFAHRSSDPHFADQSTGNKTSSHLLIGRRSEGH